MIPLALSAVAHIVGGTLHDDPDGARVTGPAFLDSRELVPGGLFAAFAGERADGHDFAAATLGAGAAGVLGSRPTGVPTVVVPDVQAALGVLARHVLGSLPDLRVIAVTGSQGKTSTKDLLAAVLADRAPTVATPGSLNNELGLPLTVLRADASTRHLLLEMGARGVGHIATLCSIARPHVSVVLNVGKAHLGEFGSQDAIARAKGELVEALPEDGVAVLNSDDPRVLAMASRTTARVTTFGTGPEADVRLEDLTLDQGGRPRGRVRHRDRVVPLELRLVGAHQALNATAAVAAALAVGVDPADAARVLAGVEALSRWRMEVHERADGVTVVNDSYNASPGSMESALRALASLGGSGQRRTVAVLGEMRELGESAADEHAEVGRLAVRLGIDVVLAVGKPARALHDGARDQGAGEESELVADNAAAMAWLREHLRPGDVVLVKASRGARLDQVAAALLEAGEVR